MQIKAINEYGWVSVNRICSEGKHDCDKNAKCIERGEHDYECVCNAGFMDKSVEKPGKPLFLNELCPQPIKF